MCGMKLSIGILAIGSLYWDTTGGRDRWRRDRLQMDKSFLVQAPIRYGRRSKNGTFTMVFGNVTKLGQARVIPCRNSVTSVRSLIAEAEWLWTAEVRDVPLDNGNPASRTGASWGCVGLMANPAVRLPKGLIEGWSCHFALENAGEKGSQYFVDTKGLLQSHWPESLAETETVQPDLLLATTNHPTLTNGSFPTVEEIARAWNAEGYGSAEYFTKNRENGIVTFQDDVIATLLRPQRGHGS
jgi:hypothetical protein